jgi:hypothetical protein
MQRSSSSFCCGYMTCFGPIGHLQVYKLVLHLGLHKVSAIAMGSLGLFCAWMSVLSFYGFSQSNLFLFWYEAVTDVLIAEF